MQISFEYIFLSLFSVLSLFLCLRVFSTKDGSEIHADFKTIIIFIICLDVVEFIAYQALAFGYVLITELLAGIFLILGSFFVTSLFVFSAGLMNNKIFQKYKVLFYLPSFLIIFFHSQGLIISGFVINTAGMLHEDGPMAIVWDTHLLGFLILTLLTLIINSRRKDILLASRSRLMLLGILPLIVSLIVVDIVPYINISVVFPLLTIYMLVSLDYITGKNIINIASGFNDFIRVLMRLSSGFSTTTMTLNEYRDIVEKEFIQNEVKKGGNIYEIAERLDIHSTTFRNKLKKYGISVH